MRIPLTRCLAFFLAAPMAVLGTDPVFSGPQPGEKTTPFRVLGIRGDRAGDELDPIAENAGAPTVLIFIHGLERSLVPLLRVIDEYGALRRATLKSEAVFLSADRLQGEQRVKAASGSLRLHSRVSLSLDGAEGPGNYGLNKDCLMTVLTAKDNRVANNFAFVQPGIADAPKVLEALASVCGDTHPPTVEELTRTQSARSGERSGGAMMQPREGRARPSEQGGMKEPFPGAVPTDDRLQGLLRRFIRATNDVATVDSLLGEVKAYVGQDAALRKQAIDGWTRVLHFGDRYGTEYSREVGRALLEDLQKATE